MICNSGMKEMEVREMGSGFLAGVVEGGAARKMSSGEIKPATDGRNDPASESCIRCDEKRGIFLSNNPIPMSCGGFDWKKNADLHRLGWLGHFDHCWPV